MGIKGTESKKKALNEWTQSEKNCKKIGKRKVIDSLGASKDPTLSNTL